MKEMKGAYWHKHYKKWIANIRVEGRTVYLGAYANRIRAAVAHDAVARYIAKSTVRR